MPLGVTLLDLRRELRAETGTSLNPAQGMQAQATMDIMLARQQRELWDAYNLAASQDLGRHAAARRPGASTTTRRRWRSTRSSSSAIADERGGVAVARR